jgi:hypothetical protein
MNLTFRGSALWSPSRMSGTNGLEAQAQVRLYLARARLDSAVGLLLCCNRPNLGSAGAVSDAPVSHHAPVCNGGRQRGKNDAQKVAA